MLLGCFFMLAMGKSRTQQKLRKKKQIPLSQQQSKTPQEINNILRSEEITVERIKELVNVLKNKYNLTTKDVLHLTEEKELLIPVTLFTKKLSALETLTKYLKENIGLSYHQIGEVLNRNEKNIWHTYKRTTEKHKQPLQFLRSPYFFPVSIFQNTLGVLENIVIYLKDELHLSYHHIAVLLARNDRTIWTMYQRAKKKLK